MIVLKCFCLRMWKPVIFYSAENQHLISWISVGPATLWYLKEPLEVWWFPFKEAVISCSCLLGKAGRTFPWGSRHYRTLRCAQLFALIEQSSSPLSFVSLMKTDFAFEMMSVSALVFVFVYSVAVSHCWDKPGLVHALHTVTPELHP